MNKDFPKLAVDINSLRNINFGTAENAYPVDVIEIYKTVGIFFYNSTDDEGNKVYDAPTVLYGDPETIQIVDLEGKSLDLKKDD